MSQIEVFADIACPFAHVGLRRFVAERERRGLTEPTLRVRAWPLELVNDSPHSPDHLAKEVVALQADVAPELFAGFDPHRFPTTTLSTLAAAAAANRAGPVQGEAFSLAVRDALWEHGVDVSDEDVLLHLAKELDLPTVTADDRAVVRADLAAGRKRGVEGSPHWFTPTADYFCPSMDIDERGGRMTVRFDEAAFAELMASAFG
jgi:predicted DsbA family dithiol-disulfide isomerase